MYVSDKEMCAIPFLCNTEYLKPLDDKGDHSFVNIHVLCYQSSNFLDYLWEGANTASFNVS